LAPLTFVEDLHVRWAISVS